MSDESLREEAATAMRRINQAWLAGQVEELAVGLGPLLHPDIVMVSPGFAAGTQGRQIFLAGFIAGAAFATPEAGSPNPWSSAFPPPRYRIRSFGMASSPPIVANRNRQFGFGSSIYRPGFDRQH